MALCLFSAALASDAGPAADAGGSRSLLFGSMPRPSDCLLTADKCDWDLEEYRYDGTTGVCIAKRPTASDLTWYDMDHGKCTVESANATHLVVKFDADSGVLFTSAPYRIVLDPRVATELSDMRHYEGKAVAMSVHREGAESLLFLGTVESVNADGSGVIVGERLSGPDTSGGEAPSDCVLRAVKAVDAYSAIGMGTCTSRGDGGVTIAASRVAVLNQDGQRVSDVTLSAFTGLNGALYDDAGDYEVFTIREASPTQLTGDAYFSTRLETWDTDIVAGEEHIGECTFFIDPVPSEGTEGTCTRKASVSVSICPFDLPGRDTTVDSTTLKVPAWNCYATELKVGEVVPYAIEVRNMCESETGLVAAKLSGSATNGKITVFFANAGGAPLEGVITYAGGNQAYQALAEGTFVDAKAGDSSVTINLDKDIDLIPGEDTGIGIIFCLATAYPAPLDGMPYARVKMPIRDFVEITDPTCQGVDYSWGAFSGTNYFWFV